MGEGSKTPTVDQLRKEIDRGQAADKVAGVDPAAAPLGTDDEAAGNPPTREERAIEAGARRREPPQRPTAGDDATASLRNAEVPGGAAGADMPGGVDSVGGSMRPGEEMPERGGRVADVATSREDDAGGTQGDDPSPAPHRRADA